MRRNEWTRSAGIALCAAALIGCPSPEPTTDAASGSDGGMVVLRGALEKGPFLTGSTVTVGVLEPSSLAPNGTSYTTSTSNDLGEFQLALPTSAPIQIDGNGFYYNEAVGALSLAPIVLRALYVPGPGPTQTAHVNVITHLTIERVRMLVSGGMAFDDAVTQAETELRTELAITAPAFDPHAGGVELTIAGGDTDANAYLFAVSAVLAYTASLRTPGSADANLQELVNRLSLDLRDDGTLGDAVVMEIHAGALALSTSTIESAFAARLTAVGSSATVPDLDRVLDQDGDGLANADDDCPLAANVDQADGDGDGHGDACDECPATTCPADCIPAEPPALAVDLCVERCPYTTGTCSTAGDICVETYVRDRDVVDHGGPQSHFICASACDPNDPSSCDASEYCGLARNTFTSPSPLEWRCLPANPTATIGTGCQGRGLVNAGCAHGLVCDGADPEAFPEQTTCVWADCRVDLFGACRPPCGGSLPACGSGTSCVDGLPPPNSPDFTGAVPRVCDAPGLSGARCASPRTCGTGLICFSMAMPDPFCEAPHGLGEACNLNAECTTGYCSTVHACSNGAPGDECQRPDQCVSGVCTGGTCG